MRALFLAGIAAGMLLVQAAHPVTASIVVPLSVEELAGTAGVVLTATVLEAQGTELADGHIETVVRLRVDEALAGDLSEPQLVLHEPGGTVGDQVEFVAGGAHYSPGESVLLFADPSADGAFHTAHMGIGKFELSRGAEGRRHAARRFDAATYVIPPNGVTTDDADLLLDDVLDRIRRVRPPSPSGGPAATLAAPDEVDGTFTAAFTYGSPQARLFAPDLGVTVPYYVDRRGDAQLGATVSVRAATAGLAAWTDVDSASLTLANGGLTTNLSTPCPDPSGEPLKVRFNNPDGTIANPVDCHGMLALTSYRANTAETKTIDSRSFGRIRCANVTFASGWGSCAVWTECNLGEIAAHELGHTIGFGHSADPDATMYAVAHFDGRCASLRPDDIAGVSFLYPPLPPPSQLVSDVLPPAVPGQPYQQELDASGGTPPYSWSLERSDYCGLRVEPVGQLDGTPSGCLCRSRVTAPLPTPAPSPYVYLKVTDSAGDSHTRFVHVPFVGSTPGTPPPTCTPTPSPSFTATRTATLPPTSTSTPSVSPTTTVSPTLTPTPVDTATATAAPTNTPSPTVGSPRCPGDCDGSGEVTVDELVQLVNQALAGGPVVCTNGDLDGSGTITVDEIVTAVNAALNGCPVRSQ